MVDKKVSVVLASEFRDNSGKIYNEVTKNGAVEISHRSRPDMLLITKDAFNQAIKNACEDVKNERLNNLLEQSTSTSEISQYEATKD